MSWLGAAKCSSATAIKIKRGWNGYRCIFGPWSGKASSSVGTIRVSRRVGNGMKRFVSKWRYPLLRIEKIQDSAFTNQLN